MIDEFEELEEGLEGKFEVDMRLVIFGSVELTTQEYGRFSELYNFYNFEKQNLFNIALFILKHRLKSNTQTAYDKELIVRYASLHGLTLPFNLRELDKLTVEVLFGVIR